MRYDITSNRAFILFGILASISAIVKPMVSVIKLTTLLYSPHGGRKINVYSDTQAAGGSTEKEILKEGRSNH